MSTFKGNLTDCNARILINIYSDPSIKDSNVIPIYNGYDNWALNFTFSVEPISTSKTELSKYRTFLKYCSSSNFSINVKVLDKNSQLIKSTSVDKTLITGMNYQDSMTDDQVIKLKNEVNKPVALDETSFKRGEKYSIDVEVLNYSTSSNSNHFPVVKNLFEINKFPTFNKDVSQSRCFALYGPKQEEYKDDNGFINSFKIYNIPPYTLSNNIDGSPAIYYCIKKTTDSSFSRWKQAYKYPVIGSTTKELNEAIIDISKLKDPSNNGKLILNKNDKIKFAIVMESDIEINLNKIDWTTDEYFKMIPDTLPVPQITNIKDGDKFPSKTNNNGSLEPNQTKPLITGSTEYLKYYEDVVIEITSDNGKNWIRCNLVEMELEGPTYEFERNPDGSLILDENGDPIIKRDEFGNPIIIKPAVKSWFYEYSNYFTEVGNYTIQARARLISTNKSFNGKNINFTIFEYVQIFPEILYFTPDDATKRILPNNAKFASNVFIGYKEDDRFSDIFLLVDGAWTENFQEFSSLGEHVATVEGINKDTGESTRIQRMFSISNELPEPIVIKGVIDYDVQESYTILIQQNSLSIFDIYYVEMTNPSKKIYPTLVPHTDSTGSYYKFNITGLGVYTLTVTATHKTSGLSRTITVNSFEVTTGQTSEDFLYFNPTKPPLHSTIMHLVPTNIKNKLTYWLDNKTGNGKKYLSPILILKNTTGYGREQSGSKVSECSKKFNGIIDYLPEEPTITGVSNGGSYYTERKIRFVNNATKPLQAEYVIFLDGQKLENPFDGEFKVSKDGYHYIFILGWDNVRPFRYLYKEFKFLIKSETELYIRKPGIIVGNQNKQGEVTITINFSKLHPDVVHKVVIIYNDGKREEFTYPYNVGVVTIKVNKNCHVTATSEFRTSGYKEQNDVTVDNIYDTKPDITEFKIFGIIEQTIHTQTFGDFKLNIGPLAWINFPKDVNDKYEVYVNGMSYMNYSEYENEEDLTYGKIANYPPIIENETNEIRKYRLEVIAKNGFDDTKISYYYNEFIIDSLGFAFPKLNSLRNNIMNKVKLPTEIHEKHEENINDLKVLLNNRITDIKTYLISKDDEYILTMTYTYYNGCKRTSSFYFSINSNAIDDLKPLRMVLKVKDFQDIPEYEEYLKKGIEPEAKDGEFIIDRQTGHLYFGNKNGTTKIDIVPITKDLELVTSEAEEYLLLAEGSYLRADYYYKVADEMIIYYEGKLDEFLKKLHEYYDKLNKICQELDKIKSDLEKLHEEVTGFEADIENNTEYIAEELKDKITGDTNLYTELNNNFSKLIDKLKDTFERGSIVKDDTFQLEIDIKKKVTIVDFEKWKQNEEAKYNRFVDACKRFFGY